MILRSCCIALVGLNLAGAVGTGKKARSVRSKSCVTKLFVAGGVLVSVEAGRAVELAREVVAAAEAAMVERGGSVIDPRRLHVEKPTKLEMTFYFSECQNCSSSNNNKLRRFNESVVTVSLTENEPE